MISRSVFKVTPTEIVVTRLHAIKILQPTRTHQLPTPLPPIFTPQTKRKSKPGTNLDWSPKTCLTPCSTWCWITTVWSYKGLYKEKRGSALQLKLWILEIALTYLNSLLSFLLSSSFSARSAVACFHRLTIIKKI